MASKTEVCKKHAGDALRKTVYSSMLDLIEMYNEIWKERGEEILRKEAENIGREIARRANEADDPSATKNMLISQYRSEIVQRREELRTGRVELGQMFCQDLTENLQQVLHEKLAQKEGQRKTAQVIFQQFCQREDTIMMKRSEEGVFKNFTRLLTEEKQEEVRALLKEVPLDIRKIATYLADLMIYAASMAVNGTNSHKPVPRR